MRAWKSILAVVLVFGAGAIFGGLAAVRVAPMWHLARQPARETVVRRINERIDRDLSLTPEQRRQVEAIIADNQRELAEIRRDVAPRVRRTISNSQERIRALLTPEQQREFDRLIARGWRSLERAER